MTDFRRKYIRGIELHAAGSRSVARIRNSSATGSPKKEFRRGLFEARRAEFRRRLRRTAWSRYRVSMRAAYERPAACRQSKGARMCHVTNEALFGKKFNRGLEKYAMLMYNNCVAEIAYIGLSPNGKALDSDSSISRFESLQPSSAAGIWLLFFCPCMASVSAFLIKRLSTHILCNYHSLRYPLTSGITVKGYADTACKYPNIHRIMEIALKGIPNWLPRVL